MDGGRHRRALLISAILIAVTLLVYAPVRWHTFVDYACEWEPIPDDGLERYAEGKAR